MKLIECHIAGFGTFTDFKLSFDEGLNVILQPNGWGKTTLAAYIKAMLYGFDRKRKRDVSENERLRYKPWKGKKYGGTLDFEYDGHEYCILRSFGATASGDTCKIVDIGSGQAVDLKGQEPGEWVFGLDCAAFQKSVFVGQNGFALDGSTAGLRNRLNAFVNEADDVAGLDSAKAALDERRKFYVKTGGRGRIAEISQQMARLVDARARQDMQVSQVAQLHTQLQQLDKQAQTLAKQAQAAQVELDEARKGASDFGALCKVREQLVEQERQARDALSAFDAQNGKAPSAAELEKLNKAAAAMERYTHEGEQAQGQAQEAAKSLQSMCDKYAGKVPARDDVEAHRAQFAQWRRETDAVEQAPVPAEVGEYAAVEAALASDPDFVQHAEEAANGWVPLAQTIENARAAQMRLDVAEATWHERRAALSALVSRAQLCEEALPEDAAKQLGELEGTAQALREAGTKRDAASGRLAELGGQRDQAARDASAAQAHMQAAGGEQGSNPAGIACLVLGILVAATGLVLFAPPISYAVAAAGVVLAVVGAVLFSKARAQARARAEEAQAAISAVQKAQSNLADVDGQVEAAQAELAKLDAELEETLRPMRLSGASAWQAALGEIERRRLTLEKAVRDSSDARERLEAMLETMQVCEPGSPAHEQADPFAAAQALLSGDAVPGTLQDARIVKDAQGACEAYRASLTPFLSAFRVSADGNASDNLGVVSERLKQAVLTFRDYRNRDLAEQEARTAARGHCEQLEGELTAWAKSMGIGAGAGALTSELFDAMARDAEQAERLSWQMQQAREKARQAGGRLGELTGAVAPLRGRFGIAPDADFSEALDFFAQQAASRAELERNSKLAHDHLAAWDKDHAADLDEARRGVDSARVEQLEKTADLIARQRESVAAERARCETERAAALKALEGYLGTTQQLSLLSREKQLATSNLFTVQKTADDLDRARGALDGRYLGGLTDRFNDYAASWLDDDKLDVDVDGDFEASVHEGASERDVASYSTGYQDLLDICLRMALVDTVFETEQPFIVMDDPFANLDKSKLSRALQLLALLAHGKQIIYFTCHPSRTEEGEGAAPEVGTVPVERFTLPTRRASRELPRARAKREAQERARAQAELVAAYHVTGVTQGRAAICVADARRTITSNMVPVRFSLNPDAGARDNAFDVHFIDALGRSLCERQTVEVIDGRVVPERVSFCLTTRQDSGDTYDLIIHEHDKPETELAARVPFKAAVSFSTEDFGL